MSQTGIGFGGRHRPVGQQDGQHRRHIGADHAGSFAHAKQSVGLTFTFPGLPRDLVTMVGSHDRLGGFHKPFARSRKLGNPMRNSFTQFVHRQMDTDHTGGQNQDLFGAQRVGGSAEAIGYQSGHGERVSQTSLAGTRIGVPGIDDDRPNLVAGSAVAIPINARSSHQILGVNARGGDRRVAGDHCQVQSFGFDPAVNSGSRKAFGNKPASVGFFLGAQSRYTLKTKRWFQGSRTSS